MPFRALYVLGFAAFVLTGALQAGYGPAFATLGARFGLPLGEVGLIASAHFFGTMVGVMLGGALLPRVGFRSLLRLSGALLCVGLFGVALAPSWPLALAGAGLAGLGFGGVSVTFNVGFARLGPGSAGALNLLNACFGVGSVLSPLVVAWLNGAWGLFLLLGALALVLAFGAARLPELPERVLRPASGRTGGVLLGAFALFFALYVGVEAGVGSWMTTQLAAAGVTGAVTWTSAFWLAVTLGRVLAAPLSLRVPPARLVALCCALAALSLPLTALTPVAYLVAGLAVGPIFGTTLAWFGQHLPTRLAPVALASGGLGGTLFPALLGRLVGAVGTGTLPYAYAATALSALLAALLLNVLLVRTSSAKQPIL